MDRAVFRCGFCEHTAHGYTCTLEDCSCNNGMFAGMVPDGVTVPLMPVGFFIMDALNQLPDPEWAARNEQPECCCTICCGPCAGLRELERTEQLDPLLRLHFQRQGFTKPDWDWWDVAAGRVDRAYLNERIDDTRCWNVDSHEALLADPSAESED